MQAVILDIDDTLLRSAEVDGSLYIESVKAIVGDVSFRPDFGDYEFVTDTGILLQVLRDNSIDAEVAIIDQIKQTFFRSLENHIARSGPFTEIPGARKLLDYLTHADEYEVGIATGGWRITAELKLRSAGIDFGNIPLATSDDAIDRRDIMRIALAGLNSTFDSITYFGDGIWDAAACKSLGWNFRPVGPDLDGISDYNDILASCSLAALPVAHYIQTR